MIEIIRVSALTLPLPLPLPTMLNLFTNKRFSFCFGSETEPISRYTLITECKQEIYLFTTFYRDQSASHVFGFCFPHLLVPNVNQTTTTTKRLTSILLEIQKQVFEFNLSINSVTHGKIMSAQYYEPTTTFPFKIMSSAIVFSPAYIAGIALTRFFLPADIKKGLPWRCHSFHMCNVYSLRWHSWNHLILNAWSNKTKFAYITCKAHVALSVDTVSFGSDFLIYAINLEIMMQVEFISAELHCNIIWIHM